MLPTTAQTKGHGGRSQRRLRVRASVTQSTRSYTIYPWKKIVSPEPHKATDTSHSKVLGFVSHLHEMHCESLDYTAKGFGASDVQKPPALIPEKREYQGAGAPWHLKEPKQPEII